MVEKGVTGTLWLWLKRYVTGRMHCVCLSGSCCELQPVVCGVLQGSIQGPLLFLKEVFRVLCYS